MVCYFEEPPVIRLRAMQQGQWHQMASSNHTFDLKESLEPPNLETTVGNQNQKLKYAPPFHSSVGALCRVSMCPFSYNNVGLFVSNLIDQFRHSTDWEEVSIRSIWR